MPMRALCGALIVCMVLAGCALIQPRVEKVAKHLDCDGSKDCVVVVNVDCSRYFSCDLSVDYDLVVVQGQNRQQDIHWQLVGEKRAEFASDGIVIQGSVFDCKAEGKTRFSCRDKHPDFGVFKYAIHVTVKDSPFGPRGVQSLDPWVVNR